MIKEQLKSVTRHERKIYNSGQEYYTRLVKRFFERTYGKNASEIQREYDEHDRAWRSFAKQVNRKIQSTYMDEAMFESVLTSIPKIRKQPISSQGKLQMIRTIRLLRKDNQLVGFFKDFGLWWNFIFNERKAIHRQQAN